MCLCPSVLPLFCFGRDACFVGGIVHTDTHTRTHARALASRAYVRNHDTIPDFYQTSVLTAVTVTNTLFWDMTQ
jgi:hypothetical protein